MKKGFVLAILVSILWMSSVAFAGNILWDTSHYTPGGLDNYLLFGEGTGGILDEISTAGHNVDRGTSNFLGTDLSAYDAIVVTGLTSETSDYTAAEVTKITDFVSAGGGLLIVSENYETASNSRIQPIATEFNATLGYITLDPSTTVLQYKTSHPILNGVSELDFDSAGVISLTPPSTELVWVVGDGWDMALVAAAEFGSGHVVMFGDTDLLTDNLSDNWQLTLNTLEYITTPVEAPEPATVILLGLGGICLIRRKK